MDLVSFEDPEEYRHFAKMMHRDNISSVYTSGRKCNFQNKGCDAEHLQPININGWFWADGILGKYKVTLLTLQILGNKRIPPTNIPSRLTFWSRSGEENKPQPDNHSAVQAGKLTDVKDTSGLTIEGYQEFYDEACLAVLNNKYNDGIQWHDVPCYFRLGKPAKFCVCRFRDIVLIGFTLPPLSPIDTFFIETFRIFVDSSPCLSN